MERKLKLIFVFTTHQLALDGPKPSPQYIYDSVSSGESLFAYAVVRLQKSRRTMRSSLMS